MEHTGKLAVIARTKNSKGSLGFKIEGDDGWFSAMGGSVTYLEKMKRGDAVNFTYEQKGVYRNVTKISKVESAKADAPKETKSDAQQVPEYTCEDCGATLKDGKYKKCYTCNQKNPTVTKGQATREKKSDNAPTSKDVQIQRGNSLNSASAVLKGNFEGTNTDVEKIKQATLNLAEAFLDWLRLE
jgi:hypothetical protein